MGDVVELRVHGVGGAPPTAILDDPHPRRVRGDKLAGFWRPGQDQGGHQLEAYAWGGLTSRESLRALWLLLLPFALTNLAGWMQTPGDVVGARRAALVRGVVRLLALCLTAAVVLWLAALAVDLVAYQCAGDAACSRDRGWFAVLRPFAEHAGRRIAVGALAPALGLGLLWFVAGRSAQHYERFGQPQPMGSYDPAGTGLDDARFWQGAELVARLRSLHVGAGLLVLAVAVAHSGAALGIASPLAWQVPLAALVAVAAAVAAPTLLPGAVARAAVPAGLVAVAWAAVDVATGPVAEATPQPLPGLVTVVAGVALLQLVLVVLLALLDGRTRSADGTRPALLGFASASAATLSILMLGSVWAGSALLLARRLGGPPAVTHPPAYALVAAAFTLVLGVLVGALLVAVLAAWRPWGDGDDGVTDEYDAREGPLPGAASWARGVARARRLARLTDRLDAVLAGAMVVAVTFAIVGVALPPTRALLLSDDMAALDMSRLSWLWTGSAIVTSAVPLGAVLALRSAFRNQSARRRIGIVWDVITFWPRAFHPLAPPSYAERAVPELQLRLRVLTPDAPVVVSAHSQGSVLSVAALAQLDDATLQRVALCTHGAPLGRLYRRMFPAYVHAGLLVGVARGIGWRWGSWWRQTDPIGGVVFVGADGVPRIDECLPDPATRARQRGDPWPAVRGHSDYDQDATLRDGLAALAQRLAGGPAQPRDAPAGHHEVDGPDGPPGSGALR